MSQKLFGEASKRRNKKQGGQKVEQEKLEGKSLMIIFSLSIFPMANEDRIKDWAWRRPPPLPFHPDKKYTRNVCL